MTGFKRCDGSRNGRLVFFRRAIQSGSALKFGTGRIDDDQPIAPICTKDENSLWIGTKNLSLRAVRSNIVV